MAGRNYSYPRPPHPRTPTLLDSHRLIHHHQQTQTHPADVIEAQNREIQILLGDNQRLAATHVALKQELAAADQDLRHLSSTAAKVKADCDARVGDFYERSLKTEAELRSLDGLNVELSQVKADIEEMTAERKELTSKLREINDELASAPSELAQLPAIEEELQAMRQEIKRGRAAIEYEKKMHVNNLEQSQIMENNIISMTHEIEKLRIELANAGKRARAAAAAAAPGTAYPSVYATPDATYGGNLYPEHYPMQQVQVAQVGIDASPQYGPGGVPHGPSAPYDLQLSNVHR